MSAAAILKLQASGFSVDQVSALADLIDTQAATKVDVEASGHKLDQKIDAAEHRLELKIGDLKSDIEATEHRLEFKIADVKTSLQADSADTKADVRVLKWMMGFLLAFQLLIVGKLFIH